MNVSEVLKLESDLLIRMPVKHKLSNSGKEVEINTLTVAQVVEMHPYLSKIAEVDLKECQNMIETFEFSKVDDFIGKYLDPIRQIIKIAIGDDHSEVCTFEDYFILLSLIFSRMGNLYFQKSITLATMMSPSRKAEIIAANKFLTSEV